MRIIIDTNILVSAAAAAVAVAHGKPEKAINFIISNFDYEWILS